MKSFILVFLGFFSVLSSQAQTVSDGQRISLQIGGFKNTHDLFDKTLKKDSFISCGAKNSELFFYLENDSVAIDSQKRHIDVAIFALKDLGFSKPVTYNDICTRALGLGLNLCTPEVGIDFWKHYKSDTSIVSCRVAMSLQSCLEILSMHLSASKKKMHPKKPVKTLYVEALRNGQMFDPNDVFVFVR